MILNEEDGLHKMRTLLTVLFLSALSLDASARLPGFEELSDTNPEQQLYNEAKRRALRYIENARPQLDASQKFDANMAIRRLSSASLFVANNPSASEHCQKNGNPVYMFVNPNHVRAIFICDIIRNNVQQDEIDTVAQLLIHEAVHLGKIHDDDECNPTKFELDVMRLNQPVGIKSTITRDGYGKSCNVLAGYRNLPSTTGFRSLDQALATSTSKSRGSARTSGGL